ncbi:MAG: hypothetical protein ACT4NP_06250 [Pseudonocardiales bacterium]
MTNPRTGPVAGVPESIEHHDDSLAIPWRGNRPPKCHSYADTASRRCEPLADGRRDRLDPPHPGPVTRREHGRYDEYRDVPSPRVESR